MQDICSEYKICPKTIDLNLDKKYFIMELYDSPLFKLIEQNNGILSENTETNYTYLRNS